MTNWEKFETAMLVAAVRQAPSVHNTQPWVLELRDHGASLYERLDRSLPRHDPTGRDRMISCGAALTNLLLAVRVLGWDADFLPFPDQAEHPDEVARVVTGERRPPSDVDLARYGAIARRSSYHSPFANEPVPEEVRDELIAGAAAGGVQTHLVHGQQEARTLAELIGHTGQVLRDDRGYQRELAAWTGARDPDARWRPSLPWTLVRSSTTLPAPEVLAARVSRETVLLLETPQDGRSDHLLTGCVLQDIWLAAVHAGLVASVLTQPLRLAPVRDGLVERLGLTGFPQVMLRLGYPFDLRPPGPRPPAEDAVGHEREESTS
jgi:nitroreductase